MRVKRMISGLLAAVLTAGLLILAPASAAGQDAFSDIPDAATANAAETLRALGVVDGTGGSLFRPEGTLTRAEFCKLAVEILGRGDEEPAQRGRTIFTDVGSGHWARGYVNLAASITVGGGEGAAATRLIMGVGDGSFQPDRPITYGEAVTMLCRVLGYADTDVASGANWYDGYVALAASLGLSDGVSLGGGSTITRGQAAMVFYNLLFAKSKGSESIYLTNLGGRLEEKVILLSTDAAAEDGTTGSVRTTAGVYKTDRAPFDSALCGTRGQLVLDKEGKLLTVLPEEGDSYRAVTVLGSPEANAIPVAGGEKLSVTLSTPVYHSDKSESTTYETEWTGLRTGASLVLAYNGSGKLDYIYMASGKSGGEDSVMVLKSQPSGSNPFSSLTGGKVPQLYKNGAPAQASDLRQYDVGSYDKSSNTLFVSDLKLSGLYEDAYPNPAAPSKITMMGLTMEVLPDAMEDLAAFQVGDKLTLLLTTDGLVAGAVSPETAGSNAVGVARVASKDSVTVELLDGLLTLTGKTTMTESAAQLLNGRLVTVSSHKKGYLSLTRVTGSGATAALDLTDGSMGKRELSPGARFFEQVGNGPLTEVPRSELTMASIPASKITYVGYDWAGRAAVLVLNDVTGDSYQYGAIGYDRSDPEDEDYVPYDTITVTYGSGQKETYTTPYIEGVKNGTMGGVAPSLDTLGGQTRLAGYMPLTAIKGVGRARFDLETMTLTTNELVLPISEKVVCWNKTTDTWYQSTDSDAMAGLKLALAFSNNLTVYYDRTPQEGGKVRVVVAE